MAYTRPRRAAGTLDLRHHAFALGDFGVVFRDGVSRPSYVVSFETVFTWSISAMPPTCWASCWRASKAKVCARPCRAHFRAARHDRYRVFVSADVRRRAATMKTLDDDNRLRQDVMGPPRMSLVRRRRTRALAYWLAEQLWMQRWPFDSSRRELLHRRRRYRPAGLCRSSSSLASALVLILNAAQRYCCSGAQAGKPFTLQWSPHRQ